MDYKFQINLRGIIDLLSQHLYSGPQVYIRELLQNGVDAIRARSYLDPQHQGEISIEVVPPRNQKPSTLLFADNGVGLTEEEIHRFLATIGASSKRGDVWDRPTDFIGQFGIGLLSCFVVSDEIVVITRSAKEGSPTMEWRGRPDGTYTIKTLESDFQPGTQVYLTGKKGSEEYFTPEKVRELALHFGGLLPFPIRVIAGKDNRCINEDGPPWRRKYAKREQETKALLEYGRQMFQMPFFDAVKLHSAVGEVEGVAFVLPFSPNLATKRTHRVYLKNMLLSEEADDILPEWAFFVKCVVNANDLRPMASRESFYEDEKLATTRETLGNCLRAYLVDLAERDPRKLQQFIALHHLSIKALAVQDDEFYRIFIDWLPFETSMGEMTLGEYRKEHNVVRYVPSLDQFRQIAGVAAAQDMCILNAGYTHDADLLGKLDAVFPEAEVEIVDPSSLAQSFEDLTLEEQEEVFEFVKTADKVLKPYRCAAEVKKFQPAELPTLYVTGKDADFLRSLEQSQEIADPLWSSVLGNIAGRRSAGPYAQLSFNYHNPLIRKLAAIKQTKLLQRPIQLLYVQALLLGHRPLSAREMGLLNEGLLEIIEWGVDAAGGEPE